MGSIGPSNAPNSPSSKARRSNKGPRNSPTRLSKEGLGGGTGRGGSKKGHPLTAAYAANASTGERAKSKITAALKAPGSSRGILSKNLTSSGVLKLSKPDPAGILQSPKGGGLRGSGKRVGHGASSLPPAQPLDRSNGYYLSGAGGGNGNGIGGGAVPPPRSGGSSAHGNVMAEIQKVMASEVAGVSQEHRDRAAGALAGGKALKSNIPRLSRLDASTIKNGHLLL